MTGPPAPCTVRSPGRPIIPPPRRRRRDEWMDDPALARGRHERALAGLARINRLSDAGAAAWAALRPLAAQVNGGARVGDLACGGGEVVVEAARRARADDASVAWLGCDVSDVALDVARRRAADAGVSITFERRDVIAGEPPRGCDALMCSLFLHHLDPPDVVWLLRRMGEAAGRGIVVMDLSRTWTGLALAAVVPRLITRSAVVHVDAVRSARAAYTAAELADMAERAGLHGASIERRWPARMILHWMKR